MIKSLKITNFKIYLMFEELNFLYSNEFTSPLPKRHVLKAFSRSGYGFMRIQLHSLNYVPFWPVANI